MFDFFLVLLIVCALVAAIWGKNVAQALFGGVTLFVIGGASLLFLVLVVLVIIAGSQMNGTPSSSASYSYSPPAVYSPPTSTYPGPAYSTPAPTPTYTPPAATTVDGTLRAAPGFTFSRADPYAPTNTVAPGPRIGVGMEPINSYNAAWLSRIAPYLPAHYGFYVSLVEPGSPAERANIKVGDFVETVDNMWIVGPNLLPDYLNYVGAGRTVVLLVDRQGVNYNVPVQAQWSF